MLIATCERIAGHRVKEVKGQCFGVVVRSRGLGGNLVAGLRMIVPLAWLQAIARRRHTYSTWFHDM